jgi:hypothetical protein
MPKASDDWRRPWEWVTSSNAYRLFTHLAILFFMHMFLPNLRSACKHSKPMGEQSCGVRRAGAH